jgi:hypothetical protein
MTPDEQRTVFDLALKKISEEEFLRRFGISRSDGSKFALSILEKAYGERAAIDVECGVWVGFHFGFSEEHLDILRRLSEAEWHRRHEDVVTALGELHDNRAGEALYRAALKSHPYLEYDDSRALAVKAIWALGRLKDPAADEKLRLLAQSSEPIVSEEAANQLRRRGLETLA